MKEALPKRPAGGREDDFDDLNDWTLMDIATAPNTSPEDRENAEAEIARREKAGTFDPDNASQDVFSDLTSHGYDLGDGKILYPKSEYKSWLKSDRSTPIPTGTVRESIEERLADEERSRDLDRATGKIAMQASEDKHEAEYGAEYGGIEKINHPTRVVSANDERKREYRANEKARDIKINEQRNLKESNKYENPFFGPAKIAAAEKEANLPIYEEVEEQLPKSPEARARRLYNYYERPFKANASEWVSFGVSNLLEKGIVDPSTSLLLHSGFGSREEGMIHEYIDPDNSLSTETINAEAELKTRVTRDLIDKRSEEISEETLRAAKYDGSLRALATGARVENYDGEDVVFYSIPVKQGEEVREFMEDVGISFEYNEENKALAASFQGFANIIEAIKNNDKETEKAFQVLDWYYDNFHYKKHLSSFLGTMDSFQEKADVAWMAKFEEYCKHREEIEKYYEELEKKEKVPEFESIKEISEEDLEKLYQDLLGNIVPIDSNSNPFLFPDKELFPPVNNTGSVPPVNRPPIAADKLYAIIKEYGNIKLSDPYLNVYRAVTKDRKQYIVIRFGIRNSNIAIVAPITEKTNDASYVWIEQDGNNRDAWMYDFLENSQNPNPISKYRAHHNEKIKAHNHIAAPKQGLKPVDNMWRNIYKDIDKRA